MTNTNAGATKHPGDFLKEILAERDITQNDLAFILALPASNVNQMTSGRRGISAEMSKALGAALSLPPGYFAELQTLYDISCAKEPDATITVRANLLAKCPVREMVNRKWLHSSDTDQLPTEIARFFEVSDLNDIPDLNHAAKKTDYFSTVSSPSQLAWLYRVRNIAKAMIVPPYSSRALRESLNRLREMVPSPEETRHIPRLMTECGVRLVIVETLPQTNIDGVCLWLNDSSPVIGLSMRYDRIDNFWFVLRHEIEHVLNKDGMKSPLIDADLEARVGTTVPEIEMVANEAAANFCVSTAKLTSFLMRKHPFYYEKDVLAFAKVQDTHPGIVVGQMQRKLNRYDYLKKYQVKVRQYVLPGAIVDGWGQAVPI